MSRRLLSRASNAKHDVMGYDCTRSQLDAVDVHPSPLEQFMVELLLLALLLGDGPRVECHLGKGTSSTAF